MKKKVLLIGAACFALTAVACWPSNDDVESLKQRVEALEAHQAQVEAWAPVIDAWISGSGDEQGAAEWLLEIEPLICGLLPVSDRPVWCVDGDTPPPPSPPGCIFGMC